MTLASAEAMWRSDNTCEIIATVEGARQRFARRHRPAGDNLEHH
jgi:hypothetical protein